MPTSTTSFVVVLFAVLAHQTLLLESTTVYSKDGALSTAFWSTILP
jgi:hypothetical protein